MQMMGAGITGITLSSDTPIFYSFLIPLPVPVVYIRPLHG